MGYLTLSNLFSVIKGSILGPKLLRYMNDLPTDGICKATENFFSKFCIQLKLAKKKVIPSTVFHKRSIESDFP